MKWLNILKGLLPARFKVGDVIDYRGKKRVEKVKFYSSEGTYFYWFEGIPNMPVSEKVLKNYAKSS